MVDKATAYAHTHTPAPEAPGGTLPVPAAAAVRIPGPSAFNSALWQVEPQVAAWALHTGLLSERTAEQARRERHASMAAHVWPWAPSGRLTELARLTLWMFAVDDRSDALARDPAAVHAELDAMIRTVAFPAPAAAAPVPPAVRALADIVPRIGAAMGPAWRDRFGAHLAAWLRTNQDMLRHRAGHAVLTPEAYAAWRRVSGATGWFFDLVEYAEDAELTPAEWSAPACRRLREAAADVIGWTNDLFSLDKELASGETANLVLVLRHHRRLPLREAVAEAQRLHTRRVAELTAAGRALRAEPTTAVRRAAIRRYTDGIHAWARGFLDFSRASARYAAGETRAQGRNSVPGRNNGLLGS
ncbi:terpene synthase family protein [Streptomyces sp. NPDC046977]|uniref:terpene synthase family protein n=1 Tax=Streptomyces sp. NPDC046977 TaxID=3154703 RepID=UPI0033CB560B